MQCPWCDNKADIKQFNKRNVDAHLLILVDPDNHYHIHAPFASKRTIHEMLIFMIKEVNKHDYSYTLASTDTSNKQKNKEHS